MQRVGRFGEVRGLRRPAALQPGDRVAVVAASSPVPPGRLTAGLGVLRSAGFDPVVRASALAVGSSRSYLAGDDALRAGDLVDVLTDPGVAAVWFARGGSGAHRTLAALDDEALRRLDAVRDRPKVCVGYSDVTAVLEFLASRLGWVGVHGPVLDTVSTESLTAALELLVDPTSFRLDVPSAEVIVPGRAVGVTMGGNLSVLAAGVGTPSSWPARGGILLLEDIGEAAYRVDRLLTQLRRSGYLDGLRGIVLGRWHECEPADVVREVLAERLGDLGVPVLAGVDIGHGGFQRPWPVGVPAVLDTARRCVEFGLPPLDGPGSGNGEQVHHVNDR